MGSERAFIDVFGNRKKERIIFFRFLVIKRVNLNFAIPDRCQIELEGF